MSTFILIHGSWHGSWCWRKVVPFLEQAGHHVLTPDLPGRGGNPFPTSAEDYIQTLSSLLVEQSEVILVGHSMAGTLLSAVGERHPEKIAALVYLAAFLVPPGKTKLQIFQEDRETSLHPYLTWDGEHGLISCASEAVQQAFYADCAPEDIAFAQSRLVPEPMVSTQIPTEVSQERFGRIPRYYIECTKDRAIGITTQRKMQAAWPCRWVFPLESSHSPFLSMPEQTVRLLLAIEREVFHSMIQKTTVT